MIKEITGGVCAAQGFKASGIHCGVKEGSSPSKNDLALILSDKECAAAGVYTMNRVKAAPIYVTMDHLEDGTAWGVVANSGNANACCPMSHENAEAMCTFAAKATGREAADFVVCSTGVIGMQLKMEPVKRGAKLLKEALADTREAAMAAAEAIMTTDTCPKECAVEFETEGKNVIVGGMSKGSGMIHPNMATMLSVITTDACIGQELLLETLQSVVGDTFNMISVDRDTSTNDTCIVLANGMSGIPEIKKGTEAYEAFREALLHVARELAKQMAGDGEGCTKLLEVKVENAATVEAAKQLSKSVITSNLVKTAVYGSDANWGRILCALGYAGVEFDPETVDLTICAEGEQGMESIVLVKDGVATGYSEEEATKLLSQSEVSVICDMKQGNASAVAWGCDLTYDYVKINGDYRS